MVSAALGLAYDSALQSQLACILSRMRCRVVAKVGPTMPLQTFQTTRVLERQLEKGVVELLRPSQYQFSVALRLLVGILVLPPACNATTYGNGKPICQDGLCTSLYCLAHCAHLVLHGMRILTQASSTMRHNIQQVR